MSVVAPTYQRRHSLPEFVEPLLREPGVHEVVLAVDGSTDGSVEWLRERAGRDARLKVLDLPSVGVGAARRAGFEAATGEVVLLMDDDVIADPGLVVGHARHHCNGGRKLVLGYMPNEWQHLAPGRRGIARLYRRYYEAHVTRLAADPNYVLHGLWGGNLSMPRAEFAAIGAEEFAVRRGQDDRELGLRALKAGLSPEFDPSLSARHLYDRPLADYRRDCRAQGESRKQLHELHGDILGPDLVRFRQGSEVDDDVGLALPEPLRRIWPRLARDPMFGVVTGLLTLLFHVAVRTRSLRLETFTARGIGSLEVMRGVLDRS